MKKRVSNLHERAREREKEGTGVGLGARRRGSVSGKRELRKEEVRARLREGIWEISRFRGRVEEPESEEREEGAMRWREAG